MVFSLKHDTIIENSRSLNFFGMGGVLMVDSGTARFSFNMDKSEDARELMRYVLSALQEKGYNPVNQLVGYFMSGDPTYITNHKGARGIIRRMERDELLEVIIREYCQNLNR